jgi:hypothetical protein
MTLTIGLLAVLVPSVAAGPFTDPITELQPLVVEGGQLPDLQDHPVGEIWAYRYDSALGLFLQIPLQVDERMLYDLTEGQTPTPVFELTYDWFGTDDGIFDADDEIAVMLRDAGGRAPDTDVWVAEAEDTRIELRVEDPLTGDVGWIYLFTSPTINDVDPELSYVAYTSADPSSGVAVFETPTYLIGYEGRWRLTRLEIVPHPDLLDRVKVRAYALVGSQTEETYENTSQFLGAWNGKVRALREVQGAASGPLTTVLDSFYSDTWVRVANLRVHAMPDIWTYYDYLSPAVAGRFYSSVHLGGVAVDGENDTPAATAPAWSQMSLPDGTLVLDFEELTPFPWPDPGAGCAPDAGAEFYWRDDDGFDDLSGDDPGAWGNHGTHLHCTADTNASPYSMATTHYFLPPQDPYVPVGGTYAAHGDSPPQVTASPQVRAALTDATISIVDLLDGGRVALGWIDALGEDGYEVYRGLLRSPFVYGHDTALECELPPETESWITPDDQVTGQPSYYYLVVPRRGAEREWGKDGDGEPRPPSGHSCP